MCNTRREEHEVRWNVTQQNAKATSLKTQRQGLPISNTDLIF